MVGQQLNLISETVHQSGMSKTIPIILPYPKIYKLSERPELIGIYSYIIKPYKLDGISLLYCRTPDIVLKAGDWAGNTIDLTKSSKYSYLAIEVIKNHKILELLNVVGVSQAQLFISDDIEPTLVDVQVSLNKVLGPGMINDVFKPIIKTQEVLEIKIVDGNERNAMIKPSKYRMINDSDQSIIPLYAMT